jgi:8-oxo-dGTP diphosphatase
MYVLLSKALLINCSYRVIMVKQRAAMIVIRDGSILLMHRIRRGEEFYAIPGGTLEEGETFGLAAIRELEEETTLTATLGPKLCETDDELSHCVYFMAENVVGTTKLSGEELARACEENQYAVVWISLAELSTLTLYPKVLLEKLAPWILA